MEMPAEEALSVLARYAGKHKSMHATVSCDYPYRIVPKYSLLPNFIIIHYCIHVFTYSCLGSDTTLGSAIIECTVTEMFTSYNLDLPQVDHFCVGGKDLESLLIT